MEKRNKTVVYGVIGACGGAATLVSAAGPCTVGDCSACFRCFGMGVVLVALALFKRIRRNKTDGVAPTDSDPGGSGPFITGLRRKA
jgi:hypothetical protein